MWCQYVYFMALDRVGASLVLNSLQFVIGEAPVKYPQHPMRARSPGSDTKQMLHSFTAHKPASQHNLSQMEHLYHLLSQDFSLFLFFIMFDHVSFSEIVESCRWNRQPKIITTNSRCVVSWSGHSSCTLMALGFVRVSKQAGL